MTRIASFFLRPGSAGIEAATNIVVEQANRTMLLYVYAAVIVLCFITFRSWRAVVVAVVPLMITSILCEALMVALGIGVKVATLPVIALGVGIGVDYALYLLSVQLAQQRAGLSLTDAYKKAVQFTGKVVALVGITLAAGVITLGVVANQVPGRHGHPAHVHVSLEHARRTDPDSGAVVLPAAHRGSGQIRSEILQSQEIDKGCGARLRLAKTAAPHRPLHPGGQPVSASRYARVCWNNNQRRRVAMRISRGKIARRCTLSLTLMGVAAWSLTALVGDPQGASAQQIGVEQYQSQLQTLDSPHDHLAVGSVEEIFARMR